MFLKAAKEGALAGVKILAGFGVLFGAAVAFEGAERSGRWSKQKFNALRKARNDKKLAKAVAQSEAVPAAQ